MTTEELLRRAQDLLGLSFKVRGQNVVLPIEALRHWALSGTRPSVVDRVLDLAAWGMSSRAIAAAMREEGYVGAKGQRFHLREVERLLMRRGTHQPAPTVVERRRQLVVQLAGSAGKTGEERWLQFHGLGSFEPEPEAEYETTMTPLDSRTATLDAWTTRLAQEAEGLDFDLEEDRVTFRTRVLHATENMRVSAMAEVAKALGRTPTDRSRDRASRAMADAWIARIRGTNHCKMAAS